MINGGKGEQLKMFMTPEEIKEKYQPLDADMSILGGIEAEDYSWTGRSRNTAGIENEPAETWRHNSTNTDAGWHPKKDTAGNPVYYRTSEGGYEEDSFWQAKGEEIEDHMHSSASWDATGPNLFEQVESEGVKYPVHLGTQFGSLGKPQIVGGHHRIQASHEVRPGQVIPVLHHYGIDQAKRGSGPWGGYK